MNAEPTHVVAKRRTTYVIVFVALVVGFASLRNSNWKSDAQFHTMLEAVAMMLASFVTYDSAAKRVADDYGGGGD